MNVDDIVRSAVKTEIKELFLTQLVRGKYQPRQEFDQESLDKLAQTIKRNGILQNLVVRPLTEKEGLYEIIAGERRWRAAHIAGLEKIPCRISHILDEEAAIITVIENTARVALNPIEEAQAILKLIEDFQYTHEEVAEVLGKPRSEVSNLLRLFKLDSRVRVLLKNGRLSESHGKILAGVSLHKQYDYAKEAVSKEWSVHKLENTIKKIPETKNNFSNQVESKSKGAHLQLLERNISEYLGAPVKFDLDDKTQQKGTVKIRFTTLDELDGILERVGYRRVGCRDE